MVILVVYIFLYLEGEGFYVFIFFFIFCNSRSLLCLMCLMSFLMNMCFFGVLSLVMLIIRFFLLLVLFLLLLLNKEVFNRLNVGSLSIVVYCSMDLLLSLMFFVEFMIELFRKLVVWCRNDDFKFFFIFDSLILKDFILFVLINWVMMMWMIYFSFSFVYMYMYMGTLDMEDLYSFFYFFLFLYICWVFSLRNLMS